MILLKKTHFVYVFVTISCFVLPLSPIVTLLIGILLSVFGFKDNKSKHYISFLLKLSIILLGFGISLKHVLIVSKNGFLDTTIVIVSVLILGFFLGSILKLEPKLRTLISVGTAICGGSAIAAISPLINAREYQISFSLIIVFILNSVALIIFPFIGQSLNMNQETFGLWAAIAIHDTSSVVGAAAIYGEDALKTAIPVKLARMLWIVPLAVVISFFEQNKINGKMKIPWFIAFFLISSLMSDLFPNWKSLFISFDWLGKKLMILSLFFVGLNISITEAKEAGLKSFIFALLLWTFAGLVSFLLISTM